MTERPSNPINKLEISDQNTVEGRNLHIIQSAQTDSKTLRNGSGFSFSTRMG